MSYLLQLSIGPVQSFIEASRKTRDLASGSALLVDLGKEVVNELALHHVRFIVPADKEAEAANIILVQVDSEPAPIVEQVKNRVHQFLTREFSKSTKGLDDLVSREVADQQLHLFPEVFAAWVPLESDYKASRKRLSALMAARKSTRDFAAYPAQIHQPKSPLAPQFDGVLKTTSGWQVHPEAAKRAGHLKPREHLDSVSLLKRLRPLPNRMAKEDMEQFAVKGFPSTRLIAVMDQLKQSPEECELLRSIIADFDDLDLGDAMFPLDDPEQERAIAPYRNQVYRAGKPRPYFAVIHADGDHMGKHLDAIVTVDRHRDFSKQLSAFASKVPLIVSKHSGVPVYSGGDDVLAFSGAEQAVAIATELADAFKATVEAGPTLTVGVAICHVTDDLQSCVDFARSLEKEGKDKVPNKNALAIGVRVRSGSETRFAASWNDHPQDELRKAIDLFKAQKLTRGFPYELRELARETYGMPTEGIETMIRSEANRIFRRKNPKVKSDETFDLPSWVVDPSSLARYASLLAIAHFMTRRGES